ncbi:gamma-glutamylcyclotransferase [Marinobacter sp.]|uniref:gamma-glutamylcyclotransferase family protein n=1 Tax=Marinobacter sp. TaxID=50741 RepID=UPI00384BC036
MSENSNEGRDLVAVYGTLKRGNSNHGLISDARFLGRDRLKSIRLYDLGPWPGAVAGTSSGIDVEVYEVNEQQMERMDEIEDYRPGSPESGLFIRRRFSSRYGDAWVYLYQGSTLGRRPIMRGSWPLQQ